MSASAAYARIKSDVLAIVAKIPAGRVATYGSIGRHLEVMPRHIAYVLTMLDELDRERVPWYRVVADGGAIGRHKRRDDQIERLKAEGLSVSAAGIVQDLVAVAVSDLAAPPSGVTQRPDAAAQTSRSRGIKGRPVSTLK